jgi:hypothetical protein
MQATAEATQQAQTELLIVAAAAAAQVAHIAAETVEADK